MKMLNDRQRCFVKEYVRTRARQGDSALRAGYSPSCCDVVASRLLNNSVVCAAIRLELENILAMETKVVKSCAQEAKLVFDILGWDSPLYLLVRATVCVLFGSSTERVNIE